MTTPRVDTRQPSAGSKEFSERVVLITGGSSGIGLATALRFAEEGAKVAILSKDPERLATAASEIQAAASGDACLALQCDVTDEAAVMAAFQDVLERWHRLDVVVSNAGTTPVSTPAEHVTLRQWEDTFAVHCTGYFLVAREAVRVFRRQGRGGALIFVSSDNGLKPSKEVLAYNCAKAAELHMARCLAEEYGPHGIRVNSVLPGAVFGGSLFWTPEFRAARAARHGFNPDRLEEEYKTKVALGVIILPEDVAEAVLFLASDRSSKCTGTMIMIDGGGAGGYVR
jgi:NAD(P)-dependent dehydrogenase (short-subunit alcohol dehydrogenase family)